MKSGMSTLATLFAGAALFGAAPAVAQPSPHGFAPHPHPAIHRPAPLHSSVRPFFHPYARPGFHGFAGRRAFVRPGFHPLRPALVGHVGFAHFTPAERAVWTRGRWSHRWWHGRWGWWWLAGGTWFWYGAPVYPYPTVVSDYYFDQPDFGPASWYYCYDPAGYYPYVSSCNGPWQPVPAQGYGYYDDNGPEQGPPPAAAGPHGQEGGPPSGYNQGPPAGYDQGPPPGYDQGPPPGYDEGPYDQGPPPGYDQGSTNRQGPQ